MTLEYDAVVVGGGIAGLSTAYELHKRGVGTLLLERGERAGGVILSEEIDGFVVDAGADGLLVQKPAGVQLCEELGLGSRLVPTRPPRQAFVLRGGRLNALPAGSALGVPTEIRPWATTRLFSWPGKMRIAAEVVIPPRRGGGDESIGEFMTRRFGREATTYLAEPLLAGIYAGDVNRLSVQALFPRLVDAERKDGSLIRAFRHSAATSRSRDGAFRSLPAGLTELVCALVHTLPAGSVRLGSTVTSVVKGTESPLRVEGTFGEAIGARAVVLAAPAFVTSGLVRGLDANLSRLCSEIPYVSTGIVAMAFRREAIAHPLDGSGFVVPLVEERSILAASWLSSKWPNRAPDDGVLIRTFVGGARDPRGLDRSDGELVSHSLAVLKPLLGIRGEPLFTKVYRWERASAQHEVGHLDRLAVIERALEKHPGLFVTGSGFRGVGIPDCVADGRRTAAQVQEWLQKSAGR